jgi:phage terminase Nu1 subunit (DNA packaging protein)
MRHRDNSDLIGLADDIAAEMSAADLAKLFDVTHRQINMLAEKGILGRNADGRFDTVDSIRRYLVFARKGGNSDIEAEKLRLTREQADKIAIQNQISQGELVSASDVERRWTAVLTLVRAAVLAVPSRVAGRAGHLTAADLDIIDREIRDALQELSNGDA